MHWLKVLLILLFVAGSFLLARTSNFSKPVDAKKTGKSCIYCHTKYGSKELTEAGKYYKDKGTLDGYREK